MPIELRYLLAGRAQGAQLQRLAEGEELGKTRDVARDAKCLLPCDSANLWIWIGTGCGDAGLCTLKSCDTGSQERVVILS